MLNTKELAKVLNVHYNTIYNLIEKGMPHYKVGKVLRFNLEEIKEWLKQQKEKE